jgi:hypothetical protein
MFDNAVLIGNTFQILGHASNFLTEYLSASDYEIVEIFYILVGFIFFTGIGNDRLNSGAFETGGCFLCLC